MSLAAKLDRLAQKSARRVLGLMSGTSVDGVDAALVSVTGGGAEAHVSLIAFRTYPFPAALRRAIFEAFDPTTGTVEHLTHLSFVLGHVFADAALAIAREAGLPIAEVDLIGSHGQTVYHIPEPRSLAGVTTRATLQLGEPAVIAARTHVLTVADFRTADIANGGQGAPLVPYADWVLFRHPSRGRAIQNIGGIGNVTYIPPGGRLEDVIAFDTGPGNMIVDALVEQLAGVLFDRDGKLAAAGRVDSALLDRLMEHPYLGISPPKTTGREMFGRAFAHELIRDSSGIRAVDLIATATAFTARSIAVSYRRFVEPRGPIDEIVVSDGGARNPTLMQMLRAELPGKTILPLEALGWDGDAKEAVAFALLANDAILGLPTNVPGATGAHRTVTLGTFCFG